MFETNTLSVVIKTFYQKKLAFTNLEEYFLKQISGPRFVIKQIHTANSICSPGPGWLLEATGASECKDIIG